MTSLVCVFGSGEMGQLGKFTHSIFTWLPIIVFLTLLCTIGLPFGEKDFREVKRPKKLPMFDMNDILTPKIPIVKLSCGGMHTAAITSSGAVFTWGCSDDGALGRSGNEDLPAIAQVPIRCTDVSLGDNHTIFYNTESNQAYFCGLYKVIILLSNFFFRMHCRVHFVHLKRGQFRLVLILGRNIP